MARERGLDTVVVTFDRHPATVVRPRVGAADPHRPATRSSSCWRPPASTARWWCPSTRRGPTRRAEDFVTRGPGRRRSGPAWWWWGRTSTSATAARATWRCSPRWGPATASRWSGSALEEDAAGQAVSSTRIRELLADGDVAGAAELLGRPHQVRGVVVHGDGRGGAELGFPTANVAVPDGVALPGEGIYACWYERPDGSVHAGGGLAGAPPTFHAGRRRTGARGVPPRLRRRPLRRAGPGVVRGPPARRGALRLRRGPGRPDDRRRGRRPRRARARARPRRTGDGPTRARVCPAPGWPRRGSVAGNRPC